VSGDQVDREYVANWAVQLDLLPIWRAVLARLGDGGT
jgi:hypothetical protein